MLCHIKVPKPFKLFSQKISNNLKYIDDSLLLVEDQNKEVEVGNAQDIVLDESICNKDSSEEYFDEGFKKNNNTK